MSPQLKEIPSNEKIPTDADVVVIGGGIIGAAATYFMSKQGYKVALVEKGQVGCEQSSRNWGWCRQQNRDERELPTSILSMHLWDEMSKDIGFDLGFRRCGLRYATDDPKQLAEWEAWRGLAKQYGVETLMLNAKEANETIPARGRNWIGGVHSIHDGKGEPAIAAPMIAEGARALGATIHQNCAARGLDITNGKVEGVITEHGTIKTNKVLCAAGAWASAFCRHHGISFPQSSVRQTAFRTKPMKNIGEALYTNGGIALTRRLDGSYTVAISGSALVEITPQGLRYAKSFMPMFMKRLKNLQMSVGNSFFTGPEAIMSWRNDEVSPFEKIRILDPAPVKSNLKRTIANVQSLFPMFENMEIMESWGSFVDCTPDAIPVISEIDSVDGFYLAAGTSAHGFGLGPGMAHIASDMVLGKKSEIDTTAYSLSRLVNGSKVKVGSI